MSTKKINQTPTSALNDLGHWKFSGILPVDAYGFVYLITNKVSGRKYIGKKQIHTIKKRKPLKGMKNKRHEVMDTDWRTYTSSCNELNLDIKKLGKEHFDFEILHFHNSKSALAYFEAKEQFGQNVLLNEDYYNGIINLRISKVKL